EGVPVALELVAQVGEVEDLAVLDDVERAVLVRDRLVAAREVDDGEPACGEGDRPVEVLAAAVGATVGEHPAHRRETLGVGPPGPRRDPADPAHAAYSTDAAGSAVHRSRSRAPRRRTPPPLASGARRARRGPTASPSAGSRRR